MMYGLKKDLYIIKLFVFPKSLLTECSIWDDALDYSYLEFCNYDLPEEDDYNFMATWHEIQTLEDVIEFSESIPVDTLPQQTLYEIVVLNIY